MKIDRKIDKTWTLFLDRDGVINKRRVNDYVKSWDEFEFLDGTLDAFAILKRYFARVIIVSNQQGVGKGVMTQADLNSIHERMCREIRVHGGDIHSIYTATLLKEHDTEGKRKPELWMAHRAKKDFPDIDLTKSIMIGDSNDDMRFGKSAGMITVCIGSDFEVEEGMIDERSPSLIAFAHAMESL